MKLPLSHPLWFVSIGLVDNLQILLMYTFNSRVFILLNHTAVVFSILILHIHVTVLCFLPYCLLVLLNCSLFSAFYLYCVYP